MFDLLMRCKEEHAVPLREARPLLRYGLVRQRGTDVLIESEMVVQGLELLRRSLAEDAMTQSTVGLEPVGLGLDEGEWAEELASIGRRRNILERKTREFIRVVLKMSLPAGRQWANTVLSSLDSRRRAECAGLAPDTLMSKLYWIELSSIIRREWIHFERFFEDKKRLQNAFLLLNERPDAHAKDVDLADVALQRRELTWLEQRIAQ
jgi:hypothetical protein